MGESRLYLFILFREGRAQQRDRERRNAEEEEEELLSNVGGEETMEVAGKGGGRRRCCWILTPLPSFPAINKVAVFVGMEARGGDFRLGLGGAQHSMQRRAINWRRRRRRKHFRVWGGGGRAWN